MTFSPKVWGDALRRLRDEIPDFAFEAWIAPLSVKVAGDRVLLGCQTSFHRDRVRIHYGDAIRRCWQAARSTFGTGPSADKLDDGDAIVLDSIEFLTMKEFGSASGRAIEIQLPERNADQEATAVVAMTAAARTASGPPGRVSFSRMSEPARRALRHEGSAEARSEAKTMCPTGDASPTGLSGRPAVVEPAHSKQIRSVRLESRRTDSSRSTAGRDDLPLSASESESASKSGLGPAGGTLQPELPFSFESFVVGPCNALAREAALALARRRQRSLNLLYLGGESGMGKTHLARATAIEARLYGRDRLQDGSREPSGPRIVYTSAEKFTSEFVSAMRLGQSEEWKRRYRGPIGMLIVEDVQLLSGRAKTQLELFHTVQHVLDAGGSVLLTGDRSPRDLVGLDERMRAQVGRGFVAELERPDALVRRHILRAKAAAGGVHLPPECLDLLVESTEGSVRDIESALIQVVTTSSLLGRTIDLDLIREAVALKSGVGTCLAPTTLPVDEVVRLVASFFGKRPEALASRSRRRDVLIPRQLAMYLAHRYTDASMTEIGGALGRDHPSVRNAVSRIERLVLENAPLRYQVEALSERIDERLNRNPTRGDGVSS